MDDNNLNTLVVLHRIYGALIGIGSCCLLGYFVFAAGVLGLAAADSKEAAPAVVGGVLGIIWFCIFVLVAGHALLNLLAANWIRDRRNWTGIFVVSIVNCLNMPLGLALGVFTIIVINRPWVKATFAS